VRSHVSGGKEIHLLCCWTEVGFEIWPKTKKTWSNASHLFFENCFLHIWIFL